MDPTGGAALAGFYLGHRTTEDLDLFAAPGVDLDDEVRVLHEVVEALGARLEPQPRHPDFRRFLATRGSETCVVDLVIDRAPSIDRDKVLVGEVRLDTAREIAANKVCTILSRSEIKDLIDLAALIERGQSLEQAIVDARRKDASVDPATLAWLLSELTISREARLPGGVDPVVVDRARNDLVKKLRELAFARVTK